MQNNRRNVLIGLCSLAALSAGVLLAARLRNRKNDAADLPDPKQFQSGDFVWPKKKGVIVPYSAIETSADQKLWETQRAAFLARPNTDASPDVIKYVNALSYSSFADSYFQDASEGAEPALRSAGSLSESVGHVGIIEVDGAGKAYVIEATPIEGQPIGAVIRLSYDDWINDYTEHKVWHGRMDKASADERKKIATAARAQIGKPYDFFNFNLDDDSAFYCSKLAWFSTFRALNIAPDGNPNPNRGRSIPPWFSPKQLANAKSVVMLHKPGNY